MIDKAVDF